MVRTSTPRKKDNIQVVKWPRNRGAAGQRDISALLRQACRPLLSRLGLVSSASPPFIHLPLPPLPSDRQLSSNTQDSPLVTPKPYADHSTRWQTRKHASPCVDHSSIWLAPFTAPRWSGSSRGLNRRFRKDLYCIWLLSHVSPYLHFALRRLLFILCLPFSPWTSPSSIAGPFITLAIFALEVVHLMTIPIYFLAFRRCCISSVTLCGLSLAIPYPSLYFSLFPFSSPLHVEYLCHIILSLHMDIPDLALSKGQATVVCLPFCYFCVLLLSPDC